MATPGLSNRCLRGRLWRAAPVAAACILLAQPASATDEIQVYNAGIAELGQLTIQQHLNYVASGLKTPEFPGAIVSNHSLNGTPEFAYGLTPWWEVGLYLPFSIQDQRFYSDAFKLRTLFVTPQAEKRDFFYGVNFEFSNETPPFAQTRWAMEIRPIIGVRNAEWEFIVNPIVDIGFGTFGEQHFAPAARLARKFGDNLFFGLEYYSDLGQIGAFPRFADQQHSLFLVTDFKAGVLDVNFGVGFGLTPASDHLVFKTIIGYAFPVAGSDKAEERAPSGPVNPMAHAAMRPLQP
jgi:hypothetical protein